MIPMKVVSYSRVPTNDEFDDDDEDEEEEYQDTPEDPNSSLLGTSLPENVTVTKMRRNLGLIAGISMIVGNVVGSGIFVSPKGVLMHSGSIGLSLIIWVVAGLISLLGALSYVELGLSYPNSGGGYVYLYETIGEFPAFVFIWVTALGRATTSIVIVSMTFANYLLYAIFTCVHPPESSVKIISALVIMLLSCVNIYSVKGAASLQVSTTFGKMLALVIIIGTGIVHLFLGHVDNLMPEKVFLGTTQDPGTVAVAIYQGLFAYSGWDAANVLIEELKNPCRNLPLSILISIPLITSVYLLANIAYFSVLNTSQLLHSPAVAVTFGYATLGYFAILMPLFVACSTFGSVNGTILIASRTAFVAARKGHLPESLAMLHIKYLTPVHSIIATCVVSLVMLLGNDVYRLITYIGFLDIIFMGSPVLGLLIQRYRNPALERPFRIWTIIPVVYVLICTALLILPWYSSPVETSLGLLICLTGVPAYFLGVKYEKKPRRFREWSEKMCRFVQKFTLSVSED